MATVDYAELKKNGFMPQIQAGKFSMRLKVIGGQLTTEQLAVIAKAAKKYGKDYIHLTSRQGVEIPFISLEDIEDVKKDLAAGNVVPGTCGARVRTITACQGNAVCKSANIETTGLAGEIDARCAGKDLPRKFKIGITGCRNNCLKAEENDVGIKGALAPAWNKAACTFCGLCEKACPHGLITIDAEKKELTAQGSGCVFCGRCVKACPVGACKGKVGYKLSFGGMFGNDIRQGLHVLPLLFDKEQVFLAVDAAIAFFQKHGIKGERFGTTIARMGEGFVAAELRKALGFAPEKAAP